MIDSGLTMHGWVADLMPICRSLSGDGVRETLKYFGALQPSLEIKEVPTGTTVADWIVPKEWRIREAYVETIEGLRVIDFAESNLHVVGYSTPVNMTMTLAELESHLHTLPDQPSAIPYVTSYYAENWGFCLSQIQRDDLGSGPFHVVIDSELFDGNLTYGELVIPGFSSEEILISTYVCHPSMANNELSGPAVSIALSRWLESLESRHFTYRILLIPETIGSIIYISQNLENLKKNVKAGWVLTCIGDNRTYSFVPSRLGNTLSDRISKKILQDRQLDYIEYSFLDRGSDERQWCWPGVDLPIASLMRSKYAEYPEYHTSLDDLTVVTPEGLEGGLSMMMDAIELAEGNWRWASTTLGEPQLGKRGLYPTISTKKSAGIVKDLKNVLTFADGNHDVIAISDLSGVSSKVVRSVFVTLENHALVERFEQ
ncbi:DUF4910 domain-containing protein [Alpinimonas psychrophila]|uniref:Aminopeptidase-like protein n=1 Tax=Alpinimonas psychrophila TaxID=748908 RepID=A0A7W3PPG9_9MICO|nr:DUF4910 domain-containing protein [Alpinimonas psychrophila]MBA8829261.1 aminopeptidase-like protein [Alpinimonas psychrophila]